MQPERIGIRRSRPFGDPAQRPFQPFDDLLQSLLGPVFVRHDVSIPTVFTVRANACGGGYGSACDGVNLSLLSAAFPG